MKYLADLHVHSCYSIATSKFAHLQGYYQWARIKGINVVGTGDFTHPGYFKELKTQLKPDDSGFFKLKQPAAIAAGGLPGEGMQCHDLDIRFCLSAEISSIYKKHGSTRKVHSLLLAPSLEVVEKINKRLEVIGNIKSDGRPILGLDPKDLLDLILSVSPEACLIPAHVWTPWFSVFGSKSGFDDIRDCFEELTPQIFALETGLSSDPEMNWRWSALDNYTLISNSDAHSPAKLGREANLFDTGFSYQEMITALKSRQGFLGTLEFFPEEGKYHLDGHRKCGVCLEPAETGKVKGLCPVCGKPLTIGVMNRVMELADRQQGVKPAGAGAFRYIIPLPEIIAEISGRGPATQGVQAHYAELISRFGNEFTMLLETPLEDIAKQAGPVFREAVERMRQGRIHPQPGFDGEFGVIRVFREGEAEQFLGQDQLFAFKPASLRSRPKHNPAADKIEKKKRSLPKKSL